MKTKLIYASFIIAASMMLFFSGIAVSDDDAGPSAKEIGNDMKKYMGEELTFRDELGYIYKYSKWEEFFRFDTQYVSCRISLEKKDDIKLLKEMAREEVEPIWVVISGRVTTPGECRIEYVFEVDSISRPIYPRDGLRDGEKPTAE